MDPLDILRRSWKITRTQRALWIFGILLALTSGGGDNLRWTLGGGGGDEGGSSRWRFEEWDFDAVSRTITEANIIALLLAAACLVVILIIISVIVRYVSATSLYRSVDDLETQGVVPMVRRGFSFGWSGRALRQFAIDLLISIPLLVAYLIMFLVALSPLLLLATDTTSLQVGGVFLAIGLILLGLLVMLVIGAVVSLLTQFWHREAAIAGKLRQAESHSIEAMVLASQRQQFLVGSLLGYASLLQNSDKVRLYNGAEAMSNYKGGSPLKQPSQRVLYQLFRLSVHARGGFIQNQDARIRQQCAGEGQ